MEAILQVGILLVESRDVRSWQILLQNSVEDGREQ